jgi:hypothetical protein
MTRRERAEISRHRAAASMQRAIAWERSKTFWSVVGALTLPPLAIMAAAVAAAWTVGQL